jgi:hypothetical protein
VVQAAGDRLKVDFQFFHHDLKLIEAAPRPPTRLWAVCDASHHSSFRIHHSIISGVGR